MDLSRSRNDAGFSLLEALLAVAITVIVMGMVAQTMGYLNAIYDQQTEAARVASASALAFDDMTDELARAGAGLGNAVPAVLSGGSGAITLWSNPYFLASTLRSELGGPDEDVLASEPERFEEGMTVLVVDARRAARGEVVRVSAGGLGIRSLESETGDFAPSFDEGAWLLALREVSYVLDGTHLIKYVAGANGQERVLTREAAGLAFDYLDAEGESIALARGVSTRDVAAVGVRLEYGGALSSAAVLRTVVALGPREGTVDFENEALGFRLSRILYPLESPAGVASRVGEDVGVVLGSGTRSSDAAYVYSFPLEETFQGALVADVRWLEDVRRPVALAFGPENGPLAGSLFVAADGLRVGHLTRLTLGSEPTEAAFEGTEAIAQAAGLVFGVDGALYVAGHEKGAIFRFRFDERGSPLAPERLFSLPGTPAAITEGTDGHLYVLVNREDVGSLWRVRFDETYTPVAPVDLGRLGGKAIALTRDPVGGTLFALVRERAGDHLVLEIDRRWLDFDEETSEDERPSPTVAFSLRTWQEQLHDGALGGRELPFPPQELAERLPYLATDVLDFIAFDARGSLYMGVTEGNLVLKFELDRPSGRHAVGIAAGVVAIEGDEVRIHAWPKGAGR